jgi:plasmid stability protein
MAQFIVRGLEDDICEELKRLARSRGQSMAEFVREILRSAVLKPTVSSSDLGTRMAARFSRHGLVQDIPELRGNEIVPPEFSQ